jgi:hypothetical protein
MGLTYNLNVIWGLVRWNNNTTGSLDRLFATFEYLTIVVALLTFFTSNMY